MATNRRKLRKGERRQTLTANRAGAIEEPGAGKGLGIRVNVEGFLPRSQVNSVVRNVRFLWPGIPLLRSTRKPRMTGRRTSSEGNTPAAPLTLNVIPNYFFYSIRSLM